MVHHHAGPAVEHPGRRHPRRARASTGGPYRLLPHPNYVAVVVEGIALPLVHTAWITALVFTVLNAALLRTRIAPRTPRWRAWRDRPARRRRRPGRAGHRPPRRARRPGGRRDRPPRRSDRQGLRRGPDAAHRPAARGPRCPPARQDVSRHHLPGLHAQRRGATFRVRHRAGGAPHRCCIRRPARRRGGGRGADASAATSARSARTANSVRCGDLRARYLAAADGLHSPIRRSLGLDPPESAAGVGGASAGTVEIAPWSDTVEVYWARGHRGLRDAGGRRLRRGRDPDVTGRASSTIISVEFPELLASRLTVSAARPGPRGRPAAAAGLGAGPPGRVLLVGDAAGYVDALTGEGLGIAFGGAELLVQSRAGRPPRRTTTGSGGRCRAATGC